MGAEQSLQLIEALTRLSDEIRLLPCLMATGGLTAEMLHLFRQGAGLQSQLGLREPLLRLIQPGA